MYGKVVRFQWSSPECWSKYTTPISRINSFSYSYDVIEKVKIQLKFFEIFCLKRHKKTEGDYSDLDPIISNIGPYFASKKVT